MMRHPVGDVLITLRRAYLPKCSAQAFAHLVETEVGIAPWIYLELEHCSAYVLRSERLSNALSLILMFGYGVSVDDFLQFQAAPDPAQAIQSELAATKAEATWESTREKLPWPDSAQVAARLNRRAEPQPTVHSAADLIRLIRQLLHKSVGTFAKDLAVPDLLYYQMEADQTPVSELVLGQLRQAFQFKDLAALLRDPAFDYRVRHAVAVRLAALEPEEADE